VPYPAGDPEYTNLRNRPVLSALRGQRRWWFSALGQLATLEKAGRTKNEQQKTRFGSTEAAFVLFKVKIGFRLDESKPILW
jgi:hypothetical protein